MLTSDEFVAATQAEWWDRAADRFCSGYWVRPDFCNQPFWYRASDANLMLQVHSVHLSKTQPGMLAYYRSVADAERDRLMMIRPGRYLRQFVPELNDEGVAFWSLRVTSLSALRGEFGELIISDDVHDIVWAYVNGPRYSCMSEPAHSYDCGGLHPAELYAAGDLSIAYLRVGDLCIARTLVWPEHKLVNRLYVVEDDQLDNLQSMLNGATISRLEIMRQFQGALLRAGYAGALNCSLERGENFTGARLRRVHVRVGQSNARDNGGCENDYTFACPYIDIVRRVSDNGTYLIIDRDGEYEANRTDGQVKCDAHEYYCANCGCACSGSDLDSDNLCENCAGRVCCADCGSYYDESDIVVTAYGDQVCRYCSRQSYTKCNECDDLILNEEIVNGYCQSCYEHVIVACAKCDASVKTADAILYRGQRYCSDCVDQVRNDYEYGLVFPREGSEEDQLTFDEQCRISALSRCQCGSCADHRARARGFTQLVAFAPEYATLATANGIEGEGVERTIPVFSWVAVVESIVDANTAIMTASEAVTDEQV